MRFTLFFALVFSLYSCGSPTAETPSASNGSAPATAPAEYDEEMLQDADEHAPPGYYENLPTEAYNPGEYDERFRPEYHFTPLEGWMNDPNGMVYYDGEWHLFYQHFPDSNRWGPMHWGHAISTDLVNWQHLPIALYPDEKGYIFSGSVVVDHAQKSPFGKDGEPAMVAMFTYHDIEGEKAGRADYETQGIAYSNDHGRTWTKYAGNPVIPNRGTKDFRDPKVLWDEKTQAYTMVLAAADHVEFFSSPDLVNWTYLSSFGKDQPEHFGVWECPELIPMTVEETGEEAYVLIVSTGRGNPNGGGSATYYYTGNWDGKTFTKLKETSYNKPGTKWLDHGRDNYAAVTFADVPDGDGRTILMGWMSNWQYAQDVPTEGWRSAMTVPRNLRLYNDPDFGYRLHQAPVKELERLRGKKIELGTDYLEDGITTVDLSELAHPGVFELNFSVDLHSNSEALYFTLTDADNKNFYRFGFDRNMEEGKWIFTSRDLAGLREFHEDFTSEELTFLDRPSNNSVMDIRILFDKTSAEVFLDDGLAVATDIFFPTTDFTYLVFEVSGGQKDLDGDLGFLLERGDIWELK
ncbi:glycoside hydrolase family 32 protein [Lewinella sp. 4G2]|uniref:glycoside hydrolase family 32 protein n=1 Tax=Lewinella sp. 4G2 TaxID=1803372 RepID=UPI0007B4C3A5|nr:glycoside hydrolase family 32 protein [Lewinella sp. 4G2]OAV44247.1 hypothetical protein A3850_006950 [Lewinella sp. 4G2]